MTEETKKPKRVRRSATGAVQPREITKIRNEVGDIRTLAEQAEPAGRNPELLDRLNKLYTALDRLDLRFKIHHDKAKP